MPGPRPTHRLVATGVAALLAAVGLFSVPATPAGAVVTPHHGFRATVDGFTSWYGSYAMGPIGTAWCIDHGIAAPDPAYGYVPTDLAQVPTTTRTALAWVLGRHGRGDDPVTHAALMLVLHDLMGATYPSGRLDVHRLRVDRVAGFRGHEAEVLRRARYLKAEALARGVLHAPLRLDVSLRQGPDGTITATVRLRDAAGRPVPAVEVAVDGLPGGPTAGRTGADGTWRTGGRVTAPVTVRAAAVVPRLSIEAWAPTARRAQRVARPATERLEATAHLAPPPTTTTSTTTTVPPTTTTSTTSTTTTVPPTTTTEVPTTTTPTTTTPTTATPTVPDTTVPPTASARPPAAPALPRTGIDALAWALVGLGLVLLGGATLQAGRAAR